MYGVADAVVARDFHAELEQIDRELEAELQR
jgi:hypothetical protein